MNGATTTVGAEQNVTTPNKIEIKPNKFTWRSITISNIFKVCREMQSAGNIYGLPTSGIDTHIMKNSEWGAVRIFRT